ncbi:MAG: Nif3-like dinuclear metal center hexameric protein [Armatimonadetes bacterium]|nr:Nif3-like dinuclear metal center hexameric protein [Armatimonadota bacterium]
MVPVSAVLAAVERLAPPEFAFSFDKVGLQVGVPSASVGRVVVSLDSSLAAIRYAASVKAQVLVSHHPLIWDPIKNLAGEGRAAQAVRLLMQNDIAIIGAHTNWDCAPGGINDVLAEKLGLMETEAVGFAEPRRTAKIVTFVPPEHETSVIDAMSEAGAGSIGLYHRCAFSSLGTGTYEPQEGSDPYLGKPGDRETVGESRVEMVTPLNRLEGVVKALTEAHPYDEPAYDVVMLREAPGQPAGRVGFTPRSMDSCAFVDYVDDALGTKSLLWQGHDRPISKVLVVGGAAADCWKDAVAAGCDAFVTGEVPQHIAVEASEAGMTILASGHYATENPGMARMAELLAESLPVAVEFYDPAPGLAGRPID